MVKNRWAVLTFSILSMVAVANFQYGWTLFVLPLQKQLNADRAAIQVTFTVFVLLETWLVPFEGYLVDRFGPRLLVLVGGVCAGVGWLGSAQASTLTQLYLWYAVAGVGAGVVYGTCVGIALKWFPDHRGLAAGLTAAGFGAGAAVTVVPIANLIQSSGYQAAFIRWGIIQGVTVVVCSFFLASPPEGWLPHAWKDSGKVDHVRERQSTADFTSMQMATTPQFWLMYVMMVMVATGGLMATAQLAPMAADFKVDKIPVSFIFWSLPALEFALSADRVINGVCRPFWGWVSDHVGREKTMSIAFGLEAIAIFLLIRMAAHPLAFVVFSAFTFFGWGEIFSLFPALCGDLFGRKHATANYGFLYTAKGTSAVLVPIGSALAAGKAFDLRADVLLFIGGALAVFAHFVGPTLLKLHISRRLHDTLFYIGLTIVAFGIFITVVPHAWPAFAVKMTMPKVGWSGVFTIAIFFDLAAAVLSYFVLRKMKVPVLPPAPVDANGATLAAAAAK